MIRNTLQKQFPIFKTHSHLHYLDAASTTQTPQVVLDAMQHYYVEERANVHRGTYELSGLATQSYERARDTVAAYLNAQDKEIIFTSGTTHAINLLAYNLCRSLTKNDNIVLTRMEHHANLIPWVQMSKQFGFSIRYIELTDDYSIDMSSATQHIDSQTKIVSVCHMSNVLGTLNPIKELTKLAHMRNATIIVDGAQAIAHVPVDVRDLDCDAYLFSGHKMYGPTGVGVLYAKEALLNHLEPFFFGGDMIKEVRYDGATWNDLPWKFEAGTPNIAGIIGLGRAIHFLQQLRDTDGWYQESALASDTRVRLQQIDDVSLIGPSNNSSPIISFVIESIHPHDVATILGDYGVAVRAGHHCAMPLMNYLGIPGTTRASFGMYNSDKDADALVDGIHRCINKFRV